MSASTPRRPPPASASSTRPAPRSEGVVETQPKSIVAFLRGERRRYRRVGLESMGMASWLSDPGTGARGTADHLHRSTSRARHAERSPQQDRSQRCARHRRDHARRALQGGPRQDGGDFLASKAPTYDAPLLGAQAARPRQPGSRNAPAVWPEARGREADHVQRRAEALAGRSTATAALSEPPSPSDRRPHRDGSARRRDRRTGRVLGRGLPAVPHRAGRGTVDGANLQDRGRRARTVPKIARRWRSLWPDAPDVSIGLHRSKGTHLEVWR